MVTINTKNDTCKCSEFTRDFELHTLSNNAVVAGRQKVCKVKLISKLN